MNNMKLVGGYSVPLEATNGIETLGQALVAIVENVVSMSQSLGFGWNGEGAKDVIPQDNERAYDWARDKFFTNWDCQDPNNPVWFEESTRRVYPNGGEFWRSFEYVTSGGFCIKIFHRTHTGDWLDITSQQWRIEIHVGDAGWGWKNSSLAQALRDAGWRNQIPAGDERRIFDAIPKIFEILPVYLKLLEDPNFHEFVDLAGIFPVDYDRELSRLIFYTPHEIGERRKAWVESPETLRNITYWLGYTTPSEAPMVDSHCDDDDDESDAQYFGASTLAKLCDSKLFENKD